MPTTRLRFAKKINEKHISKPCVASYYKYLVMLFDLSNAIANFQDCINKILLEKLQVFVIVYLDKILIYIDETNHINSVLQVLNQLQIYYLYTNLKKSLKRGAIP